MISDLKMFFWKKRNASKPLSKLTAQLKKRNYNKDIVLL
ncbi:hypothetical protein LEP1GSC059_0981 [Leptospira noguchii serovar Panama str. CZ214]|uniref:Uncharacterized protein n=1 Tax=Leptospira noguchii serovar Panama str. CZ214 TaxID=1001595 RepID=T0GWU4_9LEPT|nr:hypothetical protein LEP1GSC059_0981 [Leptospira noguchii serovar Panama str. CZ214]